MVDGDVQVTLAHIDGRLDSIEGGLNRLAEKVGEQNGRVGYLEKWRQEQRIAAAKREGRQEAVAAFRRRDWIIASAVGSGLLGLGGLLGQIIFGGGL